MKPRSSLDPPVVILSGVTLSKLLERFQGARNIAFGLQLRRSDKRPLELAL
jgi:hypothetical protein